MLVLKCSVYDVLVSPVVGLLAVIKNNVDLLEYYHPGVFSSSKWSCCHHNSKHSLGCKATFITRMKHSHGKGRSNTEQPGSTKAVLPRLAVSSFFCPKLMSSSVLCSCLLVVVFLYNNSPG